ncbi:MAG: hypothetical protein H6935_09345 [Thiobacillus sp.]|nr:hypothetical protein [Thiobacillus sp.]
MKFRFQPATPPGFAQDSQTFAKDSHAETQSPCGLSRDSQDSQGFSGAHTANALSPMFKVRILRMAERWGYSAEELNQALALARTDPEGWLKVVEADEALGFDPKELPAPCGHTSPARAFT